MADYEYDNNIEFEAEGEHITEVQQRLQESGHLTGEVTGTYDDLTKAALTSFSESQGYSYTTDLQLVAILQQATGPLQSAQWVQTFTSDAPYGHQANLQQGFMGEHIAGNQVWSGQTRSQTYYPEGQAHDAYGVSIEDGRLGHTGEYLEDGSLAPVDTTDITTRAGWVGSQPERMIYTMDSEGGIQMADSTAETIARPGERFHHSSLAGGAAVAGAGEMKVRDGVVEAVSDKSGHYRPDMAMTSQVNDRLEDGGVDTSQVTFELGNFTAPGGQPLGRTREELLAQAAEWIRLTGEDRGRKKWLAAWNDLDDAQKEAEIQAVHAELYPGFEAMDLPALRREVSALINPVPDDTLVTGTELGAYDRDGILADLRSRCWQEAEGAAQRKWKPAVWARLADPIKQSEIQSFYDQVYPPYEAMDDRTLFAEGRKILEGRHEQLREVLKEIPLAMGWREDPLGRFQWRWYDGSAWTAKVSSNDVSSTDNEGAAMLEVGPEDEDDEDEGDESGRLRMGAPDADGYVEPLNVGGSEQRESESSQ